MQTSACVMSILILCRSVGDSGWTRPFSALTFSSTSLMPSSNEVCGRDRVRPNLELDERIFGVIGVILELFKPTYGDFSSTHWSGLGGIGSKRQHSTNPICNKREFSVNTYRLARQTAPHISFFDVLFSKLVLLLEAVEGLTACRACK